MTEVTEPAGMTEGTDAGGARGASGMSEAAGVTEATDAEGARGAADATDEEGVTEADVLGRSSSMKCV